MLAIKLMQNIDFEDKVRTMVRIEKLEIGIYFSEVGSTTYMFFKLRKIYCKN